MAANEQTLSIFRASVAPFLNDWEGLDVRVIGFQAAGKNILLVARIRSLQSRNARPPAYTPRVQGLVFDRVEVEPHRLDSMLSELMEGTLEVGGRKYALGEEGVVPRSADFFWLSSHRSLEGASINLEFRLDRPSSPQNLDRILPASDPPYADVRDLYSSFLGPEHEHDGWNSRVIFTLKSGIRVESVDATGDLVAVVLSGLDVKRAEKVRASFIARTKTGEERRWQVGLEGAEAVGEGSVRWLHRLPGELTHGQLWLLDYGLVIGHADFSTPNRSGGPYERVLSKVSSDSEFLKNSLNSIGIDSRNLERWVHMAFHCLGWRSLHVGRVAKWETADVIAHSPRGTEVALIECTTSTPAQSNKLGKLYSRSSELARETALSVIPVLATTRRDGDIAPDEREAAGKSGIALLAFESLERLAEMVYEPEGGGVVEFLTSKVPFGSNSGPLARHGIAGSYL